MTISTKPYDIWKFPYKVEGKNWLSNKRSTFVIDDLYTGTKSCITYTILCKPRYITCMDVMDDIVKYYEIYSNLGNRVRCVKFI